MPESTPMCGIIGIIGNEPADKVLLNGLRRMEYRGYDSAGLAIAQNGKLEIIKASGKLDELEAKVKGVTLTGTTGIGHTRWATHGAPTEANAHPHQAGRIALVHNGIIENYLELKAKLLEKGVVFKSETDTEVLAQLIGWFYDKTNDLQIATSEALKRVRGTFGIAVICQDSPQLLIVARRGSPIVLGKSAEAVYVASDPSALVGEAKEVLYIDEDEMAILSSHSITVHDIHDMTPKRKSFQELNMKVEELQKNGYDHFLLKEIMEQPQSIRAVLRGRLDEKKGTSHLGGLNLTDSYVRRIDRLLIIGCGTAYYAGLLSKYLLEKMTGIPVDVEMASEFRYREPVLTKNTMGLIISQSGETADTLACLKELEACRVKTLGLVNVVGSTIAREVDGGVFLHAGPEISVASTKAFTSQVLAALLVGLHIARRRQLPLAVGREVAKALNALPEEVETALRLNDTVKTLAQRLSRFSNALYLGRDNLYPIALEGALKLKEVSYLHAEGYPSGEMKHGPIALIDENFLVVNLLGKGPLMEKALSNLQEVKARHGHVVIITDDPKLKDQENTIFVKTSSSWTQPLVMNVVLQLLAYHVAVARGTDVDQPRNLAKSVTVE